VLTLIRAAHTVIWLILVGVIAAVPVCSWFGLFGWAAAAAALICLEGLILLLNKGRCPLTDVAARYTEDRRPNFDIYLPEWLARHNKRIFTSIYLLGCLFALILWLRGLGVA